MREGRRTPPTAPRGYFCHRNRRHPRLREESKLDIGTNGHDRVQKASQDDDRARLQGHVEGAQSCRKAGTRHLISVQSRREWGQPRDALQPNVRTNRRVSQPQLWPSSGIRCVCPLTKTSPPLTHTLPESRFVLSAKAPAGPTWECQLQPAPPRPSDLAPPGSRLRKSPGRIDDPRSRVRGSGPLKETGGHPSSFSAG